MICEICQEPISEEDYNRYDGWCELCSCDDEWEEDEE